MKNCSYALWILFVWLGYVHAHLLRRLCEILAR